MTGIVSHLCCTLSRTRAPLLAALLSIGLPGYATAASSDVALLRGPYLQTATPNSIIIRWRTDVPTESIVLYGTDSDNLHLLSGDLEETTEHEVALNGLSAQTKYFYSIGSFFDTLAQGPDYFFFTHPQPGRSKPTRIWAMGDCGTFNTGGGNQVGVRDAFYNYAANRYTDVWLALGDNAYYDGSDQNYQENFFDIYPSILRQTPLWSTIGNHETPSITDYFNMFSLPQNAEAGGLSSGTEKYYSFDYANIHFVCLDSELSDRTTDGPMLTWLRGDLEANTNDWLIAFWHSPPYSMGSHNSDDLTDNFGNMTLMRTNAVRLLESYGVDLVLCGHSHNYERSFLLNGNYGFSKTLLPSMIKDSGSGRTNETGAYLKPHSGPEANQGAVYVVAGSSGWATFRWGFHPVMFIQELEVGSVVIDIDGQRLDAKFLRETGAIDDYFTIIKGAPAEPLRFATFRTTANSVSAQWKSVAGQTYRIQKTLSLETPDWIDVTGNILATGATTTWTADTPPTGICFFRVKQMP